MTTNEERFRTKEERSAAFLDFCKKMKGCKNCPLSSHKSRCSFVWLALEAENEKLLPCSSCGGEAIVVKPWVADGCSVMCKKCGVFVWAHTQAEAIAAWNRSTRGKNI